MVWSNNENWMVSGDDGGAIKYVFPVVCILSTSEMNISSFVTSY